MLNVFCLKVVQLLKVFQHLDWNETWEKWKGRADWWCMVIERWSLAPMRLCLLFKSCPALISFPTFELKWDLRRMEGDWWWMRRWSLGPMRWWWFWHRDGAGWQRRGGVTWRDRITFSSFSFCDSRSTLYTSQSVTHWTQQTFLCWRALSLFRNTLPLRLEDYSIQYTIQNEAPLPFRLEGLT